VIASLNGTTAEAWLKYSRLLEQAGADGLEINLCEVVADLSVPGVAIETQIVDAVTESIPNSPFHHGLVGAAADFRRPSTVRLNDGDGAGLSSLAGISWCCDMSQPAETLSEVPWV